MTPVQAKRLSFFEHNREIAMMALAKMGNLSGLMVVIADMRDSIGKPMSETLAQIEGANARAHFEKTEKKGEIPTAIMVLPIEAVARILKAPNPTVSKTLNEAPLMPGAVWVAIVAEGGTMLMQTSCKPIESSGQA